jgi:hypothetical protein
MKKISILLWIVLPVLCNNLRAQEGYAKQEKLSSPKAAGEPDKNQTVHYRFIDQYQVLVDLPDNTIDKLLVVDMRGSVVLKQAVSTGSVKIDVSNLGDGVYLLVLRSSVTLKEKSSKFFIRK